MIERGLNRTETEHTFHQCALGFICHTSYSQSFHVSGHTLNTSGIPWLPLTLVANASKKQNAIAMKTPGRRGLLTLLQLAASGLFTASLKPLHSSYVRPVRL